ncbi:MAG: DNA repair protein RecO [Pirellula sp.]|jgi:DNA repair protein RecO (recombination protein O)|nr:DNA repair protein RecO [Pirellula sp.]
MGLEKSEAILLRSVAWSETSLVVTLFTRTHGKVSAVAKGARRLKSPFENALDLLARSQIVFIEKANDTLDILTEAKLVRRFKGGQRSLLTLYSGYYLAELTHVLTENHQPMESHFGVLDEALVKLDEMEDPAKVVLGFEMEFLRSLGHLPTFELCAGCGNSVESGRNRSYLFGIDAGGVLCDSCLAGQHHVLRLREETISFLRLVAADRGSWMERAGSYGDLSPTTRGEVRFAMERFITHLADRRLRLMDFLEELKR